ncbi:NADH-quinone oxidoreductase subunit NuoK [Thalassiella azotivora]
MSTTGPLLLVAVLAGLGAYGVLARRNAVMVLVGAELLLGAGALLLVTVDAATADPVLSGQVAALFVITVAAAEIGLALAVVLLLFRRTGSSDLRAARDLGETARPVRGALGAPAAGASTDPGPGDPTDRAVR